MSRFLFVVPPLVGHLNPANAVALALAERGHEVAWVGSQARLRPVLGEAATIYPTGMRLLRGRLDVGTAAVKSLWEGFVLPFARHTLPAVEAAVDDYEPEVIVADQHALAGPIAAYRRELPWATLATSSMELGDPFAGWPNVQDWIAGQLDRAWSTAGMAGCAPDLRFSPYLVVAFTARPLAPRQSLPGHFALVGPALSGRAPGPDFPWSWLDPDRQHVLVTVGTLAEDLAADSVHFYTRAMAALRPLGGRLQAIVVAPGGVIQDAPDHVLPLPRAPLLPLMPQLNAVICHGGQGTVCEALSHAIPLVIAPIRHDQPINAARVASAGAGIRVNFDRVSSQRLQTALLTVLEDPAYAAAARRAQRSLTAAGGEQRAAELLSDIPRRHGGR